MALFLNIFIVEFSIILSYIKLNLFSIIINYNITVDTYYSSIFVLIAMFATMSALVLYLNNEIPYRISQKYILFSTTTLIYVFTLLINFIILNFGIFNLLNFYFYKFIFISIVFLFMYSIYYIFEFLDKFNVDKLLQDIFSEFIGNLYARSKISNVILNKLKSSDYVYEIDKHFYHPPSITKSNSFMGVSDKLSQNTNLKFTQYILAVPMQNKGVAYIENIEFINMLSSESHILSYNLVIKKFVFDISLDPVIIFKYSCDNNWDKQLKEKFESDLLNQLNSNIIYVNFTVDELNDLEDIYQKYSKNNMQPKFKKILLNIIAQHNNIIYKRLFYLTVEDFLKNKKND